MSISQHGRSDSSESSSSSSGSSYQLILDHILSYPGTYEIPLRSMYALNCAPRAQPSHPRSQTPSSNGSSPITPQGAFQDNKATQTFTENLMAQMSSLPSQPTSLPPSFITSFLRRCFPPSLLQIDFPQALTGLDYLKDLETRRRREVAATISRLDIERDALDSQADSLASRYPVVAEWVKSIEAKERKIDALYTQLYVGLRRWILINELKLTPFNKHNCVAMLNTLYPPAISTQPTTKLTTEILRNQRNGFFKYIQSVEKNGHHVLSNLMLQGKGPTDANGWIAVTKTLGQYLQLANSMITECSEIADVQDISPRKQDDSNAEKQPKKTDSGVSFPGVEVPSTRSSSIAEPASPTETTRPKTPSGGKHSSALEKIARGLKTIGRSRTDVIEMTSNVTSPPPAPERRPKSPGPLRKMRSMGSIEGRKASKVDVSAATQASQSFNVEEMRRQRLRYETGVLTSQKFRPNHSFEV